MTPTPIPDFQVFANEACTERPVAGQAYERMFVRCNIDVTGEFSISIDPNDGWTKLQGYIYPSDQKYHIALWDNYFDGKENEQWPAVYIPSGTVLECNAYGSTVTIANNAVVDFTLPEPGPEPEPADIEVFVDQACTTKPIVGGSYSTLYLRFNKNTVPPVNWGSEPPGTSFEKLDLNIYHDTNTHIALYGSLFQKYIETINIEAGSVVELSRTSSTTVSSPLVTEFNLPE